MDVQVAQQTSVALPGDVQLVAGKRQWQAGELEAGAAQATLLVLLPGKGLWFLTFGLSGPEVYMYGEEGPPGAGAAATQADRGGRATHSRVVAGAT